MSINLPILTYISQGEALGIVKIITKQFEKFSIKISDTHLSNYLRIFDKENPAPYIKTFIKLSNETQALPSEEDINNHLNVKKNEQKVNKMHDAVYDSMLHFCDAETLSLQVADFCLDLSSKLGFYNFNKYESLDNGLWQFITREICGIPYRELTMQDKEVTRSYLLKKIQRKLDHYFKINLEAYNLVKAEIEKHDVILKREQSNDPNVLQLPRR